MNVLNTLSNMRPVSSANGLLATLVFWSLRMSPALKICPHFRGFPPSLGGSEVVQVVCLAAFLG